MMECKPDAESSLKYKSPSRNDYFLDNLTTLS
jgi:hypothetical protein